MNIQIARDGEVIGTYPASAMPALVAAASVLPSDMYWQEGMEEWALVGQTWQPQPPAAHPQALPNASKLSVLAIVAIALGVLALPLSFIVLGAILGIGAIVCGHIALSAAKRDASNTSRNVALIGTVLGYLSVAIAAAILALQVGIMSVFLLAGNVGVAQENRVEADIQSISTQLRVYERMNGSLPTTEQGLKALVTEPVGEPKPKRWRQLLESVPLDPWGKEYIYRLAGVGFEVKSAGPDGAEGGGDDIPQ